MKKSLYLLIILCSLGGKAQIIQPITQSDLTGIKILPGYTFEGENLSDYLSAAAPLYLEYGLQKLYLNEYVLNQDTINLQVYMMVNSASAFGIYSQSVTDCMIRNIFGSFSCVTPNSIAVVNGP